MTAGALAFLLDFLPRLPGYIQAGTELVDAIQTGRAKANQLAAEGRYPSDADWEDVNSSIETKRKKLHAPE